LLHKFFNIKHMTKITVAKSAGIDPEIIDATLEMIFASGAKIEIGEKGYLSGNTSGIEASSWNIIRKNKIFLKAHITT
jgi:isocitrate dehydrogenase